MSVDDELIANLREFAVESDHIEREYEVDENFRHADRLRVLLRRPPETLMTTLREFNMHGDLRKETGMNVTVGKHKPPPGGPDIPLALYRICEEAARGRHPYWIHAAFETLHPFTDGNGRTGRALWLWQMIHQRGFEFELGFLHCWYCQSLEFSRQRNR